MNYYVKRNSTEYGPYSLADLQLYVRQGNISGADLARSEGVPGLVTVQQIVGNMQAPQPQAPAQPLDYGRVPVYSGGYAAAAAQPALAPLQTQPIGIAERVPPGLGWGWLLLLSVITLGIFAIIWTFVEANYAQKLGTKSKPLLFYGLGYLCSFISGFLNATDLKDIAPIASIAGFVLIISGVFSIKNALEEYYTTIEPINLDLSGGMTFFFNTLYFQYHFSRIRRWKLTGELS